MKALSLLVLEYKYLVHVVRTVTWYTTWLNNNLFFVIMIEL